MVYLNPSKAKVKLVDMYTPFGVYSAGNTNFSSDHLHPSDAGYQVMADTWFECIEIPSICKGIFARTIC